MYADCAELMSHPFDGLPFEWKQVEPHVFVFIFDVTNSPRFRGSKINAHTAMMHCMMVYPDIAQFNIYFPNVNRMIIQIWRTP